MIIAMKYNTLAFIIMVKREPVNEHKVIDWAFNDFRECIKRLKREND